MGYRFVICRYQALFCAFGLETQEYQADPVFTAVREDYSHDGDAWNREFHPPGAFVSIFLRRSTPANLKTWGPRITSRIEIAQQV